MKPIKEGVYNYYHMIKVKKKQFYHLRRRKKLKNNNITILSNNCLAGILYHDFQMKFNSPTINLFFETENDYIEFLSDLDFYSTTEPVEKKDKEVNWPVGEIQNDNKVITIHFMHYNSFDEARKKWIERGKRINKDNLYVLWLVVNYDGPSTEYYERFKRLNYKNKLLITGRGFPINDKMIVKPGFINKGISPGQWAEHKGKNSNKRFIDEVDFAKYFNRIQ